MNVHLFDPLETLVDCCPIATLSKTLENMCIYLLTHIFSDVSPIFKVEQTTCSKWLHFCMPSPGLITVEAAGQQLGFQLKIFPDDHDDRWNKNSRVLLSWSRCVCKTRSYCNKTKTSFSRCCFFGDKIL